MSENMIFCYSGSGHCLEMAKNIAKVLGDTDIVMMRSAPVITDARKAKRVGFIFPCYGGGLPGHVEDYLKFIQVDPNSYTFAIEQFAGYMGCGLHKIDKAVDLDYWNTCSNHSTCIWLMPHKIQMPPLPDKMAQKRLIRKAEQFGKDIKAMKSSEKKPPKRAAFTLEDKFFSSMHTKRIKKFAANEDCVSCGTCERICPRNNIQLVDGKPVFGRDCIGCLSCVQYCPKNAINVGKITKNRERYPNKTVKAADLSEAVIHID